MLFLFTSGDVKADLTVHHVFVDPDAVPGSHMAQIVLTHLALANANKDFYVCWTAWFHLAARGKIVAEYINSVKP